MSAIWYAANTMHDLGFLYSLYSVALYKLTGDPHQRALGLKAANVFAGRFIPESGSCHTSWGDYFLMEALARENGATVNWW